MNAVVLDAKLKLPKVDEAVLAQLVSKATFDDVAATIIPQELIAVIRGLHEQTYMAGLYATLGVSEHTDDSAPCDITLGVVLSGDHVLCGEGGVPLGHLVDGSVFILKNKLPHAAYPSDRDTEKPLVFIACDLDVDDFDVVCAEIHKKL